MPKWLVTVAMVVGAAFVVWGVLARVVGGGALYARGINLVEFGGVCFLAAIALELYPGKK